MIEFDMNLLISFYTMKLDPNRTELKIDQPHSLFFDVFKIRFVSIESSS